MSPFSPSLFGFFSKHVLPEIYTTIRHFVLLWLSAERYVVDFCSILSEFLSTRIAVRLLIKLVETAIFVNLFMQNHRFDGFGGSICCSLWHNFLGLLPGAFLKLLVVSGLSFG